MIVSTESSKVLVVDSVDVARKRMAQRLQSLGYTVIEACSASDAMTVARSEKPALALIDVALDETSSSDLVRALMSDEDLNTIAPIMLVSAVSAEQYAERLEQCMNNGANDWLLQPVSSALLRVQVAEYLTTRQRRIEERELVKREKLLNDVQTARRFQLDFLPKEMPNAEGWELAAALQPAREVAGDFYDVFTLTQGRRIGLVIADVCDKGVGAALFMALIRSLTRAFAQQNHNMDLTDLLTSDGAASLANVGRHRGLSSVGVNALKAAVTLTNNYIIDNHADLNMFATMFFGILDPRTGGLDYINGGHNPPYILDQDGNIKHILKPNGSAVGMLKEVEFVVDHVQIDPGDFLVTYTDGVPDARDPHGKRFKDEGFRQLLKSPASNVTQLMDRVESALRSHIADAPQFDDITLLFARRLPNSETSAISAIADSAKPE